MKLSVVIVAWNGCSALERCLRSLTDDAWTSDTEVIAVTNFNAGAGAMLSSDFPSVRHVAMASGTTVPALRTAGIGCSQGEIVALAEDHCAFGKRWCSEIKKAHDLPYAAIGGPVENNSKGSALDWAVYFYDYGKFMPPLVEGVTDSLSGNNVSFKRSVLEEVEPSFREGFFEPFTHGAIQKAGHALYLIPSALVYHQKSYRLKHSAAQCYHLARGYAAKRVADASPWRRCAYALASIALPAVLTGRIVIRIFRKKRYVGKLLWALPVLIILMISWGWGECCGYLAGAGRSAAEWK